jgi:hypothetical protein
MNRAATSADRTMFDGLAGALLIDDMPVPLTLRRNPRARRLILRLDAAGEHAFVVMPPHVTPAEARAFAITHAGWVRDRLARLTARVPFADGAAIPILGVVHRVRHDPGALPQVHLDERALMVGGGADRVASRIAAWLKAEARRQIAPRVARDAARIGRSVGSIAIRDTRSRWGSCSAGGRLSFSWRLVMAPAFVLDYVVAHEVAHLAVAGHGQAFWRTVETLTTEMTAARAWLRRHGRDLHRYG